MHRMHGLRWWGCMVLLAPGLVLSGCDSGEEGLNNGHPGANDLNVVAAFGDSITMGNCCACTPYPARLANMTGKTVHNAGINGTRADLNIGRTRTVILQCHPAYMLILYGVNDLIHSLGVAPTLNALSQMVQICKENDVLPVLATYPIPIKSYRFFAPGIIALNQGIRELAAREGICCVDLEREFALPSDSSDPGNVFSDESLFTGEGLHPNDAGTQIIAQAFADRF